MGKEWASRQTSQGNILLGRLLPHLKPDLQKKPNFALLQNISNFALS